MRQHHYRRYDTRKTTEELDFKATANMPPHVQAPAYAISKAVPVQDLDRSERYWDPVLKCLVFLDMPAPQPKVVSVDLAPLLDRFKVTICKRKRP